MAVRELSDGNDDGTRLGQSSTDKIGFFGATTVVQRTNITAATNTTTTTSTTTALTTDVDNLRARLNSVITALKDLGLVASS